MKKLNSKNLGFTLVELLVVVAIIAALATIALPISLRILNRANETDAVSTMKNTVLAVTSYYDDYNAVASGISVGATDGDGYTSSVVPPAAPANQAAAIATNGFDKWIGAMTGESEGNRRQRKYLKLRDCDNADTNQCRNGLTRNGTVAHGLLDPWGNRYFIQLDLDLDNTVSITSLGTAASPSSSTSSSGTSSSTSSPIVANLSGGYVVMISGGQDGDLSTEKDNIYSYK